jgi:hypothetical protein
MHKYVLKLGWKLHSALWKLQDRLYWYLAKKQGEQGEEFSKKGAK